MRLAVYYGSCLFAAMLAIGMEMTCSQQVFAASADGLLQKNSHRLQNKENRSQHQPQGSQGIQGVDSQYSIQAAMTRLEAAKAHRIQFDGNDAARPSARYASAVPSFRETTLPPDVRAHLAKAGIPMSSIGIYVQEIAPARRPVLSVNMNQPMNPASTMKLVTTYAAMEIMGSQYQWTTSVYRDGPVVNGVLQGNLIFKGTGDPKIGIEELRMIAVKLREMGLREITGDLILDRSYFEVPQSEYQPFDGDPDKPGNVPPDSLMLAHRVFFANVWPDPVAQRVAVTLTPDLKSVDVISNVTYDKRRGTCRKKLSRALTPKPEGGYQLTVKGKMSMDCDDVTFRFASVDMPQYFGGAFQSIWSEAGGVFHGRIRNGQLPEKSTLLATYYSPPLSDVVIDTNKRSNNMFAKQLFLGLGAVRYATPGSRAQSVRAIREWLQTKGLICPELVMENGSGLSRIERISPKSLGLLLESAAYSPVFTDFFDSLPLVGVDGTMARRLRGKDVTGNASIKTGTLRDVKCIAGYVRSLSKRDYVVVFFINHPNAGSANSVRALDRLIEWVYFDAPRDEVQPI